MWKKGKFCKEVQNKKYERQKNNSRGFYRRIKQDKKHPGVLIKLRKSVDIAYFVRDKVITMNELEGFSEDLIDAVKLILSR